MERDLILQSQSMRPELKRKCAETQKEFKKRLLGIIRSARASYADEKRLANNTGMKEAESKMVWVIEAILNMRQNPAPDQITKVEINTLEKTKIMISFGPDEANSVVIPALPAIVGMITEHDGFDNLKPQQQSIGRVGLGNRMI